MSFYLVYYYSEVCGLACNIHYIEKTFIFTAFGFNSTCVYIHKIDVFEIKISITLSIEGKTNNRSRNIEGQILIVQI